MLPLLSLVDAIVADLAITDAVRTRIHARAAELRQSLGMAAGTLPRAQAAVLAIGEALQIPPWEAYRLAGEQALVHMAADLSRVFRLHTTAHTFCLNLNSVVQSELQALVPMLPLPVVDVEMVDLNTLRLSFEGSDEGMGLAQGLLSGVARHYGQEARFSEVPPAQMSAMAEAVGRRYVDVTFVSDDRASGEGGRTPERRRGAVAVALQGWFR